MGSVAKLCNEKFYVRKYPLEITSVAITRLETEKDENNAWGVLSRTYIEALIEGDALMIGAAIKAAVNLYASELVK